MDFKQNTEKNWLYQDNKYKYYKIKTKLKNVYSEYNKKEYSPYICKHVVNATTNNISDCPVKLNPQQLLKALII